MAVGNVRNAFRYFERVDQEAPQGTGSATAYYWLAARHYARNEMVEMKAQTGQIAKIFSSEPRFWSDRIIHVKSLLLDGGLSLAAVPEKFSLYSKKFKEDRLTELREELKLLS